MGEASRQGSGVGARRPGRCREDAEPGALAYLVERNDSRDVSVVLHKGLPLCVESRRPWPGLRPA